MNGRLPRLPPLRARRLEVAVERGRIARVDAGQRVDGPRHARLELVPDRQDAADATGRRDALAVEDLVEVLQLPGHVLGHVQQVERETHVDVAQILAAVLDEVPKVGPALRVVRQRLVVEHVFQLLLGVLQRLADRHRDFSGNVERAVRDDGVHRVDVAAELLEEAELDLEADVRVDARAPPRRQVESARKRRVGDSKKTGRYGRSGATRRGKRAHLSP
mmetsp:Transcript_32185/g.99206  ORF Transcript_32185/g.99206 Transcript_32185/m.99206 type:complete len:219 (-) Transcript_32185:711-1367(-)